MISIPRIYGSCCPHLQKWRYMLSSESTSQPQAVLPQEFIDEQRAYFAEVDAFELPEEVVSATDLE